MQYKYWYVSSNKFQFTFGEPETDIVEIGPLPWSTKQALKKIMYLAEQQGRRVLRIKREKYR